MKLDKKDILHILVIILGIIFVAVPIFHENLWFDESYSVGLANHTFTEIWIIGGNDVHPILYYWILHIINLIFGFISTGVDVAGHIGGLIGGIIVSSVLGSSDEKGIDINRIIICLIYFVFIIYLGLFR